MDKRDAASVGAFATGEGPHSSGASHLQVAPRDYPRPRAGDMALGQLIAGAWVAVPDGDARAREIFLRHYSARHYKDGRRRTLFVGPGEKMVLMTIECDALFVWRKFISDDGQEGVNCAVFRNEGARLSSGLIVEAEALAAVRWPGERLYTYVAPHKIRSTNPGYCFLMAGWAQCGRTKGGLVILEKYLEGEGK